MLKEPRLGRVKTRLGQDIGMVQALWWYRHQVSWLIRQLNDPRWRLILAISPDDQVLKSRIWPTHLDKIAQGRGNLGTRMGSIFNKLTPGPVCIIGSDIPEIKHHQIKWQISNKIIFKEEQRTKVQGLIIESFHLMFRS